MRKAFKVMGIILLIAVIMKSLISKKRQPSQAIKGISKEMGIVISVMQSVAFSCVQKKQGCDRSGVSDKIDARKTAEQKGELYG